MELFERELETNPCGLLTSCSECDRQDACSWCGDQGDAVCQPIGAMCDATVAENNRACPSVGSNVVLRNVTGLLGAVVAVAVLLNVLNHYQNKRRTRKLKKSIFTLPCYEYPSRERRAAALRQARSLILMPGAPSGPARDVDLEHQASQGEEPEDPTSVMTACIICLSAYQDEEVIKVLPCGHDFHSGCLDPWLEVRAICPLCKTYAFGSTRDQQRHCRRHLNCLRQSPRRAASPVEQPSMTVNENRRRSCWREHRLLVWR